MSSLGQTLRQAREARGLTQSQVASQTRILVQIIDDIENEDFHRIAAPIYGRGFVRLYAECVGLESQPLIREFMDIYEGRRAPTVLVRDIPTEAPAPAPVIPEPEPTPVIPEPVAPAPVIPEPPPVVPEQVPAAPEPAPVIPEPVAPAPVIPEPEPAIPEPEPAIPDPVPLIPSLSPAAPEPPAPEPVAEPTPEPIPPPTPDPIPPVVPQAPEPAPEPPSVVRGLDLFEQAAGYSSPSREAPAVSTPEQATTPSQAAASDSPFLPPVYEDHGPSAAERFKNGISSVSHGVLRSVRGIPRSAWRKSLLAVTALLILALIVFGCVKLYQMTAQPTKDCEDGTCEYNPKAQPAEAKPAAKSAAQQAAQATKAPQTKAKPQTTPASKGKVPPPAKPTGKIHSTGQKIAPLYID